MTLKELIDALEIRLTPANKAEIRIIFAALGRPEYLHGTNNAFVVSKINKLKDDADTVALLDKINKLLLAEFQEGSEAFRSGNSSYDLINQFLNDIDTLTHTTHLERLKEWVMATKDSFFQMWRDYFVNLDTPIHQAMYCYRMTCEQYEYYRLGEMMRDILAVDDVTSRSELLAAIHEILSGLFTFRITILSVCARKMEDIATTSLVSSYLLAIQEEISELLFTEYFLSIPNHYAHVSHDISLVEQCFFASLSNLKFSDPDDDEKHYVNPANLHILGKGKHEMVSMERAPRRDEQDELFHLIQPRGVYNPKIMVIEMPGAPRIMRENIIFLMHLSQYDACAPLMWKYIKTHRNLPDFGDNKGKILASFYLYYGLLENEIAFCNAADAFTHFVYFFNKHLLALQKLPLDELREDKNYSAQLTRAIEISLLVFWRIANNDYVDSRITSELQVIPIEEDHALAIRQRMLIYMADLVVQLWRLGSADFDSPYLPVIFKKYFTDIKQKKWRGLDGFLDILLDRINALDAPIQVFYKIRKIVQTPVLAIETPTFTEAEYKAADEAYVTLLAELEQENQAILQASKQELKREKEKYKKKASKKVSPKPQLFEEKSSCAPSPALTPEAKEYLEIARLRQTGAINLDQTIERYLNLLKQAPDLASPDNCHYDYFYMAATLAELSDCYVRKALAETQETIFSGDKEKLSAMIKWCEAAVNSAKRADECFVNHVTTVSAESLKAYEDLASHIHDILKAAMGRLQFLQNKFKLLIENIGKTQELLDISRHEAIIRAGGIEKWRSNPRPKNHYTELRKQKSEELNIIQDSVRVITNCIEKTFTPVKADFAFLTGLASLPLASVALGQEICPEDDPVLFGRGEFKDRVALLAKSWQILKTGLNQEDMLRRLRVNEPSFCEGKTQDDCVILSNVH